MMHPDDARNNNYYDDIDPDNMDSYLLR